MIRNLHYTGQLTPKLLQDFTVALYYRNHPYATISQMISDDYLPHLDQEMRNVFIDKPVADLNSPIESYSGLAEYFDYVRGFEGKLTKPRNAEKLAYSIKLLSNSWMSVYMQSFTKYRRLVFLDTSVCLDSEFLKKLYVTETPQIKVILPFTTQHEIIYNISKDSPTKQYVSKVAIKRISDLYSMGRLDLLSGSYDLLATVPANCYFKAPYGDASIIQSVLFLQKTLPLLFPSLPHPDISICTKDKNFIATARSKGVKSTPSTDPLGWTGYQL